MPVDTFAQGTHQLGWEMIQQGGGKHAAVYSPLSATIALAMLAGAATPEAELVFLKKLGVQDRQQLQASYRKLLTGKGSEDLLNAANAIFYEQDMKPTTEYAQYLEDFHIHSKMFTKLADSVDEINSWVAQNTHDLIQKMLTRDMIENSGVVLLNALAFKGTWEHQFPKEQTVTDYPFHSAPETTHSVSMMFQHNVKLVLGRDDSFTAVCLPYKTSSEGTAMSLIAYLPNEGISVEQVIEQLAHGNTPDFASSKVQKLGFPKFELETGIELQEMLLKLGFPLKGSFPGVNGVVGKVIQRAVVKVDEEGTVAAAATAVTMPRGLPREPNVFIFDRPFAFSIVIDKPNIAAFTGIFTKS